MLALDAVDKATVGAVGADLESGLRIGNTSLGLLVAATAITGGLGSIPAGALVDRVRRTRLLPVAIVLWSAAMIVSALATSFEMLLLTRIALGAVVAFAGPSVASLTGDYFAGAERARIYGYIVAGEVVGGAFGFLISGELAALLSWRFAFALLALPGFALARTIWRTLPEPERGGQSPLGRDRLAAGEVERRDVAPARERVLGEDPARMPIRRAAAYILSVPTNLRLIVASALGYFFFGGLRTFAVIYMQDHFGVSQAEATLLLGLIVIAAIAGALAGGRLADWLIARGRITARIVVAGACYLGAAIIFGPAIGVASLAIAMPMYIVAAAALVAPNPPLDAARLDIMPARLWGRAEGVRTLLRSFAAALAPLVFGAISEQIVVSNERSAADVVGFGANSSAAGLEYTFLVMLVPLFASAFLLLRAARTYPRDIATAVASERRWERQARAIRRS